MECDLDNVDFEKELQQLVSLAGCKKSIVFEDYQLNDKDFKILGVLAFLDLIDVKAIDDMQRLTFIIIVTIK